MSLWKLSAVSDVGTVMKSRVIYLLFERAISKYFIERGKNKSSDKEIIDLH